MISSRGPLNRFAATCVATLICLSSTLAVGIDDFEDGSSAGWNVVGHGELLSRYHQSVASPGWESGYGLRLTRDVAEGWCGVSIGGLSRVGLTEASAVGLSARNGAGLKNMLVDVHCSDGSRWWCKPELAADGSWTRIELTPEHFFAVANPGNLPKLDLTKIASLWLAMDTLTEDDGPWLLEIDNVEIIGKSGLPQAAALADLPTTSWTGPDVGVAVFDSDVFLPSVPAPGPATRFADALAALGCRVRRIGPGELKGGETDILILAGPKFAAGDEVAVLDHLRKGRALWLVGATAPLSQPMVRNGASWQAARDYRASPELDRILDASLLSSHWLELSEPTLELTGDGRGWWPFAPASLPAVKCAYVAADNSIYHPHVPPWVRLTPLMAVRYEQTNWVSIADRFIGWPVVMYEHQAGEFKGARVLFAGLADDRRSILHPENPAFGPAAIACLAKLAAGVADLWPSDPAALLDGLPQIGRAGFFEYPGPIFAPLHFGRVPPDDPTFWQDTELAGFNAIHVEVPFFDEADTNGEIIDYARCDVEVALAAKHRKRIIFDPLSFNSHWRWRWAGQQSNLNTEFRDRFAEALGRLAARFKDDPTVAAMFVTPLSVGYGSFAVDESELGRQGWQRFVREELGLSLEEAAQRYGQAMAAWSELPLPKPGKQGELNLGPIWPDYLRFFVQSHYEFLRPVIRGIRAAAPDMPLLMRGMYLDVGIHMNLAAEFANVAPHCECVETTVDTEAYFRGLAQTFGVPISAENGWPKCPRGPLRMALGDYLLGGYAAYFHSFGGPVQLRRGVLDFYQAQKAARVLRTARYPRTNLAILIPDTTLYASNPPSFFALEAKPHLEFAMERSGFAFRAVSAQFPKLDGLSIIVDDGQNRVLTAECRRQLVEWVHKGGTLVAFPDTGRHDFAGTGASLADALGVSFVLPEGQSHAITPCGDGRVVAFSPSLLTGRFAVDPALWETFEAVLAELGAPRDVIVQPRVNTASFRGDGKTYVVLCNKSPEYVGAYFRESNLAAVEAGLPDLDLIVAPTFPVSRVRDVLTDTELPIADGKVSIHLPKTTYAVLEFQYEEGATHEH